MELFTMNKRYGREITVDSFASAIWTERVRGNHDFQITVPASETNIRLFAEDTFIGLVGSKIVMVVDTQKIQNNILSVVGTSLEQKLNNRFIRFTTANNVKSYAINGSPGYVMQYLVFNMAIGGPWLNGTNPMGIHNPQRLKIPSFTIGDYDNSLPSQSIVVPYGGLYDAVKAIGDAYELVVRIECEGEDNLVFRNWLGVDHTKDSPNPLVRFSPQLDNLGSITEVIDASKYKTHAWVQPSGLVGIADIELGEATVGSDFLAYTGWDLKAELILADDINSDFSNMDLILAERAYAALVGASMVVGVDGQILPTSQFKYGEHYDLGDIVEVQGTSGIIQPSRVTEFIRSQDATGEKAYPTLVAVPPPVIPFIPGISGGTDGQGGTAPPTDVGVLAPPIYRVPVGMPE